MKNFLVRGIFLHMDLGELDMWKHVKAESEEQALETIYKTYLTIEILEIIQN